MVTISAEAEKINIDSRSGALNQEA